MCVRYGPSFSSLIIKHTICTFEREPYCCCSLRAISWIVISPKAWLPESLSFNGMIDPFLRGYCIGTVLTQKRISRLPAVRFARSKACNTSQNVFLTHSDSFSMSQDNSVPVWHLPWHDMMSWLWVPRTPLGLQTLALSYLDFLSSILGNPKHVGPWYGLFGHIINVIPNSCIYSIITHK